MASRIASAADRVTTMARVALPGRTRLRIASRRASGRGDSFRLSWRTSRVSTDTTRISARLPPTNHSPTSRSRSWRTTRVVSRTRPTSRVR